MAIYNNREVWPINNIKFRKALPDLVAFRDKDGQTITANPMHVKFTKDELKAMEVTENDAYTGVLPEATDDDLKSVRLGIAPASDPEYRNRAELELRKEEQAKQLEENQKQAKAEAEKAQKANKDQVKK